MTLARFAAAPPRLARTCDGVLHHLLSSPAFRPIAARAQVDATQETKTFAHALLRDPRFQRCSRPLVPAVLRPGVAA